MIFTPEPGYGIIEPNPIERRHLRRHGTLRSLEYGRRDAFIDELFIAEAQRGQGLGREALELAEATCRELGVKALHLEVEQHREVALELYRRAGFESHDRHLMTNWLS